MKKADVILLIDFIEIHEEGHSEAYIQYLKELVYSTKDDPSSQNNKPLVKGVVSNSVCDHVWQEVSDGVNCSKCGVYVV